MKRFLKWTIGIVGVGIGAAVGIRAVQATRARLRSALGHAEAIAERSKMALEETEAALHDARTSV
jgi:hypothetical protein